VLPEAIERVDGWAGRGIESVVRRHHRRRLARLGRLEQLDPPRDGQLWCAGEPSPREGCELEVLIDGSSALGAIAQTLASARSYVHIAGWHVSPDFGLTRDEHALRLRDLLAELAERVEVRVLLWAGAPLPVFTPSRGEVRRVYEELTRASRVKCVLDGNERPMHCHHEKLVIVDGEVAFVGGIDLTSLGGDRFDSSAHPMRSKLGWHDVACRLRGPAVADVEAHFASRWHGAGGERIEPRAAADAATGTAAGADVSAAAQTAAAAAAGPAGEHTLQVVRTVPEKIYDFIQQGDFRILEAYTRALRSARELVYLESQFLWSPQVVDILADKLRAPPSDDFRVLVLLPAKPNNGADTTRGQLGVLAAADDGAGRFLATTISARSGGLAGPLYVHAKVGIVDDVWLTVGSANLNEHSLFNDSEMNVIACEPQLARQTRLRLWSEHLECSIEDLACSPAQAIDERWRPIATEQLERRSKGEPPTHRLQELPGVSRRAMALLGPVQGLLVDG
jgi:phosphatidylserine/phosphatidylglycerophosphate/cardiolipin synthase-like enzyme